MTGTRISTHSLVSLQYSLSTGSGARIRAASGKPPIQYVHGCGNLFPKLETALEGHGVGDIVHARLLPDDAFGRRDTELLHEVPIEALPPGEDLAVGNTLVGQDEQGQEIGFRITAIEDGVVKLDANHPLAGETLIFEVEIQGVRAATPEEIEQAVRRGDQRRID